MKNMSVCLSYESCGILKGARDSSKLPGDLLIKEESAGLSEPELTSVGKHEV